MISRFLSAFFDARDGAIRIERVTRADGDRVADTLAELTTGEARDLAEMLESAANAADLWEGTPR